MTPPVLGPGQILLVDTASDVRPHLDELKGLGVQAVGRYYGIHTSMPGKFLTPDESEAIGRAGLWTVSIFENEPADEHQARTYFTHDQGLRDGTAAWAHAEACRQPPLTPVYFAVDYDASAEDLTEGGGVFQYFLGLWASRPAGGWRVSVYGSGLTCAVLTNCGLADQGWLANAKEWAGYHTFTKAVITQQQAFTDGGLPRDRSDWNVAIGNQAGAWWRVL